MYVLIVSDVYGIYFWLLYNLEFPCVSVIHFIPKCLFFFIPLGLPGLMTFVVRFAALFFVILPSISALITEHRLTYI